jgi:hypothetical protein
LKGGHRSDVDDRAPPSLHHRRQEGRGQDNQRLDIDLNHAELLVRMLVHVTDVGEAGIVDERLDRQVACRDLLQEALTRRRIAEIAACDLDANAVVALNFGG